MQKRHKDRRQYFNELAATTQKYIIPFIEKFHPVTSETRILEIGCGEGGNLLPFAERGCNVVGIELCEGRIKEAEEFFDAKNRKNVSLIAANIFAIDPEMYPADIILVHDVIEHIGDKDKLLAQIARFLAPGGVVFIGFPAWQMPFGGHQQICHSFGSKLPFIHLLPNPLYTSLLRLFKEKPTSIQEMLSIKETRMTIEHFLRIVKSEQFTIRKQCLYFINPHYETKFGLKPRKLWPAIGTIPYLRNFFSTSCFYVLAR